MYRKILIPLLLLLASNTMAGAKYNSEENVVILNTPPLAENIDTGYIKIFSEKHITILGVASDDASGKMIALCGKEPSIGLLFLDGKLKFGAQTPNVTEVIDWDERSKEEVQAGWVSSYVFKGDDALDLIDLLYEYSAVGFAFGGGECKDTKEFVSGKIVLTFETRGLERAMRRIK